MSQWNVLINDSEKNFSRFISKAEKNSSNREAEETCSSKYGLLLKEGQTINLSTSRNTLATYQYPINPMSSLNQSEFRAYQPYEAYEHFRNLKEN